MLKFKFGKMVRDKIVEQQLSSGSKPHYRQLNDAQHKEALVDKIIEESKEILKAKPEEIASEIADVQQAMDDLIEKFGLKSSDVEQAQQAKNNKSGSFKKGLFIDYVEVDENDKWVDYYRDNADRYPEID